MTVRGRETLYKYFADGELPTEEHFRELIESQLNLQDEGFNKSPDAGLEITSAVGADGLMSFFRSENARQSLWTVRYSHAGQVLGIHPGDATKPGHALLTLDSGQRVGVGTTQALHTLHIEGVVGAQGWAGTLPRPKDSQPKADTGWHKLTLELDGNQVLDVVASASSGKRHAVMRATAMNANDPRSGWIDGWLAPLLNWKKRIRAQHAWFSQRCDRLELRWFPGEKDAKKYELRIRSRCDYGKDVPIDVHVTRLWPNRPAQATALGAAAVASAVGDGEDGT